MSSEASKGAEAPADAVAGRLAAFPCDWCGAPMRALGVSHDYTGRAFGWHVFRCARRGCSHEVDRG